MGKRIIQRARGKGGPRYRSPGHRYVGTITYGFQKGQVIDIVHDPGRDAPLAKVKTDGKEIYILAAEGLKVGDTLDINGEVRKGNILSLDKIPKGYSIFAIEEHPRSGPKMCLSPGSNAIIISNEAGKVVVQMPSKKFKTFDSTCLATIGIPAGGGRGDKPFINAGQKSYAMEARNRLWPITSGVKMNPVDHPFGGRTKPGMPKTVSRNAPPGRKVGSLAASRGGLKKKG